MLNLQLVEESPDTFSVLIYFFSLAEKCFWKSKQWIFNTCVNVWLLAILKIQAQPQTFIL